MNTKTKIASVIASLTIAVLGCEKPPSTDEKQSAAQASALEQAHAQIGMPAISNFAERKMMKDLYNGE